MQRFKRIILGMQGRNKKDLHWLYNTRSEEEPPHVFQYSSLRFWFGGTGCRTSEKLILYVGIPGGFLGEDFPEDGLPRETYLLNLLSPVISDLSRQYQNTAKNVREKAQFAAQQAGGRMVRRSGIRYIREENAYVLRLNFNVPLLNALSVDAKAAVRAVRDILEHIEAALGELDREELADYVKTYGYQRQIRGFMKGHGLCAFVADGSILPREAGTSAPLGDAVPFVSPKELRVRIPLADGAEMTGMGIRKGVTVITGGGYSGKSTLLDALEMGIYDHIPGDGREFVLADDSALKIYAEDGRPVSGLDLSPFFRDLPGNGSLAEFSSAHASGSVSQAANIVEAVCGGCGLLLIDEDRSATNFMIRDRNMRMIVKNDPIIPFTDRVRELYSGEDVSTILVIGGSSEYLSCADVVILMEDYLPRVITGQMGKLDLPRPAAGVPDARWTRSRRLIPSKTAKEFLYIRRVELENEKKLILDEYTADITLLTALVSEGQLNALTCVMERLLTDKDADYAELLEKAGGYARKMLGEAGGTALLVPETAQLFFEEIRPLDAFCCINRMRGCAFSQGTRGGDAAASSEGGIRLP